MTVEQNRLMVKAIVIATSVFGVLSIAYTVYTEVTTVCSYRPEPSIEDLKVCAPAYVKQECFSTLGYKRVCE